MDPAEGMEEVRKGRFAYYLFRSIAYNLMSKAFDPVDVCETTEIEFRESHHMGIGLSKNSSFRERTTINVAWMRETGIIQKHLKYWLRSKPKCLSRTEIFRSVTFADVSTSFFILIAASAFSFVLLVGERVREKNRLKRKRTKLEKIVRTNNFLLNILVRPVHQIT